MILPLIFLALQLGWGIAVPHPGPVQVAAAQTAKTDPLDVHTVARETASVRGMLEAQVSAWNRGDLDGFMEGYWNSEKLIFASSSGVSRGWEMLRNRYVLNYPDKQAMGELTFSNLEITLLSPDAAFVLGRWQVVRNLPGKEEKLGGVFTLVARKFPAGWRIIADHTSSV
jgi:ketosteroid isomerase-like protein